MRNRAGKHNKVGAYGEEIARNWLLRKEYQILADNYQKPWGEIDLIAEYKKTVHFIEVKSVSYETRDLLEKAKKSGWRPEEQVHPRKLQKLHRTIETWLAENRYTEAWQLDVIAVRMVVSERYASVKYIDNVV